MCIRDSYQVDLFTDTKKLEKEKKLQQAMLGIKNKYGKNAVLKACLLYTSHCKKHRQPDEW